MTKPKADITEAGIDVFSLPVHPWAARFPMRSDEELAAMAESIKANGLRMPVVIGMASLSPDSEPTLCLIDGRNRLAASKIAGVSPTYIQLDSEDQDAYIADVNLERRDLTKGQKAMLLAERYPEGGKGGRGQKENLSVSKEFSAARLGQARTVKRFCPELVELVIAGQMGLDEAYREANMKRAAAEVAQENARGEQKRFASLRRRYPDLADLVEEERMTLRDAEAAARDRQEGERIAQESNLHVLSELARVLQGITGKAYLAQLADSYGKRPGDFDLDLVQIIDAALTNLQTLKESMQ